MKKIAGGALLVLLIVIMFQMNRSPDLSSPSASLQTARDHLASENWDVLYDLTTDELADEIDEKIMLLLQVSAHFLPPEIRDDLDLLTQISAQKRFAAFMDGFSKRPETRRLMTAYEEAKYEVTQTSEEQAKISFEADISLPFATVKLEKLEDNWYFSSIPEL